METELFRSTLGRSNQKWLALVIWISAFNPLRLQQGTSGVMSVQNHPASGEPHNDHTICQSDISVIFVLIPTYSRFIIPIL